MKQCSKCKEWKEFNQFYTSKSKKDGLQTRCIPCTKAGVKIYRQTSRGNEVRQKADIKYHRSEKGMEVSRKARNKYQQSNKGKIIAKEVRQNSMGVKATRAVNNAVKLGKFPHVSTQICHNCKNQAEQYHHYLGYDKIHWFDVMPLCEACHLGLHHPHLLKNS